MRRLPRSLEYTVASCADRVEPAEDGEADRADKTHVHQLSVAEAGSPVVNPDWRRGA